MKNLTEKQKSVVKYLMKNPGSTVMDVMKGVVNVSDQGVRDCLSKLRKEGLVRFVPSKNGKGYPTSLWYVNGSMIKYAEQLGEEKEETADVKAAVPIPKTDIVGSAERKRELLKSLTPRELMQELRSRGYSGKLSYVQIVDLDRL